MFRKTRNCIHIVNCYALRTHTYVSLVAIWFSSYMRKKEEFKDFVAIFISQASSNMLLALLEMCVRM